MIILIKKLKKIITTFFQFILSNINKLNSHFIGAFSNSFDIKGKGIFFLSSKNSYNSDN